MPGQSILEQSGTLQLAHEYVYEIINGRKPELGASVDMPMELYRPAYYITYCITDDCTFGTQAISGAKQAAMRHRCDNPLHQVVTVNYRASKGAGYKGPRYTLIKLHADVVLKGNFYQGIIPDYARYDPRYQSQLKMVRQDIKQRRKEIAEPYLAPAVAAYPKEFLNKNRYDECVRAITDAIMPNATLEEKSMAWLLWDRITEDIFNNAFPRELCPAQPPFPRPTVDAPAIPALVAISGGALAASETPFVPEATPVVSPRRLEEAVVYFNKQVLTPEHQELLDELHTHCCRAMFGDKCYGGWEDFIDDLEVIVPCECTCHAKLKPTELVSYRLDKAYCMNCKINLCEGPERCAIQTEDGSQCLCPCMNANSRVH